MGTTHLMADEALAVVVRAPLDSRTNIGGMSMELKTRVPKLDLLEKNLSTPSAASSRLAQLTARIDRDHSYDQKDQSARNLLMESKCQAVRSRIGVAKETNDDRLKPMCEVMAQIGVDIATEVEKVDLSDKRLDAQMEKTQDVFAKEIEDLISDRASAKYRLNVRIGAACETLKREAGNDKGYAREHQEKRHRKAAERIFAVIDTLEGEHQNRGRSDGRINSSVGKKHAAVDGAILAERNSRIQVQNDMIEKIDSATMIFVTEAQAEKKIWQENQKNTMKGFRLAMTKLQDNLDNTAQARQAGFDDVADGRMVELEKLTRLIQKEATNRQQSETSMTQLLEGMHQKLHTEVLHERTERQNTERVLMKLLEESVEAIAIKTDEGTLNMLKDMRQEREKDRLMRQKDQEQRTLQNSIALEEKQHEREHAEHLRNEAAIEGNDNFADAVEQAAEELVHAQPV